MAGRGVVSTPRRAKSSSQRNALGDAAATLECSRLSPGAPPRRDRRLDQPRDRSDLVTLECLPREARPSRVPIGAWLRDGVLAVTLARTVSRVPAGVGGVLAASSPT